jgi:hypothetical protein
MTLRMSRSQCEATLALASVEHVWCDMDKFTGYAMIHHNKLWRPEYYLSRRKRRLVRFVPVADATGEHEVREGWTGWRIDELRMAVKQIVQGERPSGP